MHHVRIRVDQATIDQVIRALSAPKVLPLDANRARMERMKRELALDHAAGKIADETYLARVAVIRHRLHSLTATGADVTEAVPVSWSREQYDQSEPGFVRLRQIDSNMARPGGTITYRITPTPGGCHIECDRGRTFIGLRGHLLGELMVVFGARILRAQLRTGLDRALGSER